MNSLNVLIVDDSVVFRKILSQVVQEINPNGIIQTAEDGEAAIMEVLKQDYDVILLDIVMPKLSGIDVIKYIKKERPKVEIILTSGIVANDAQIALEGLRLGAMDFILKPSKGTPEKNKEALKNILENLFLQISNKNSLLKNIEITKAYCEPLLNNLKPKVNRTVPKIIDTVVIASSTGGPVALERIVADIESNFNKPIFIVQHMPVEFTKIMANSLDKKCALKVVEVKDGDVVQGGYIYIAQGGSHMTVEKNNDKLVIKINKSPHVNGVRPAADVLFESIAQAYENKNILSVILTGMGSDGKNGVKILKNRTTCYCITQSEKSCVVYGMPKSVYESGLSDEVVDLDDIGRRIQQIIVNRS